MAKGMQVNLLRVAYAALAVVFFSTCAAAADWVVSKASGQVWLASAGIQPASIGKETVLQPGDTIQTGPNGRVLLVRGEETILVAPNSVVRLPSDPGPSTRTSILQQAGSIVVKAQERDTQHFEVQTPYLAAVVKGTQFVVTVDPHGADVQVASGQVEVQAFKSGQIALLLPGQAARASLLGDAGLVLRGSGTFNPIKQGPPMKSPLQPANVPKKGLGAPPTNRGQIVRTLSARAERPVAGPSTAARQNGDVLIGAPIGHAKLNVHEATGGLARSSEGARQSGSGRPEGAATFWNADAADSGKGNAYAFGSDKANAHGNAGGNGNGNGNGHGNGNGNGNGNGKGKGKNK